ncbi:type IV pilin [Haloarcula hispanica]|uniref:type IV pilin n=1 Tax=Haloarcula hispanica TaxID=51589 RepID=UPI0011B4463B|nr:type IV pilin N-terminal domain-containing protein [Haloarcula hispanica]
MDIKQLIHDDDAVSPVIGVILMVAITVILAAVIASFVLGLGDQAQQSTPKASFSWEYDASPGNNTEGVTKVTHDGGDTVSASEIYVRGDGLTDETEDNTGLSAGDYELGKSGANDWNTATGATEITAGNSVDVAVRSDYDLRVVYETAEGDNSASLAQDTGPDA